MAERRAPEKERVILFGPFDFDTFFINVGVDPNSLTCSEWRKFEDMFMEGTSWSEVAFEAAQIIKENRDNGDN